MNTQQLISKMDDSVGELSLQLQSLYHIQQALGRMALEADDKYAGEKQSHFLWDHNNTLQMIDALLFRLVTEMRETRNQLAEIHEQTLGQQKEPSLPGKE
ncbi:hypothetical protein H9649_12015 [Sporosarcina sp. Sa2YVA2]|uniref:WXG100 family type VII secretion target n=1 Tax=Sporosarcina quadrami TaxID=2762234 RepID=A0ABR8UBB5_9BACL|nr:hypothetical protein [Sporosarcina quadrami]MBD7985315.1 hypothetical protein [Sporosarcina quadrami]